MHDHGPQAEMQHADSVKVWGRIGDTKEKMDNELIRELTRSVASVLGFNKNAKLTACKTSEECLTWMKEHLPSAQRNRMITAEESKQKDLCRRIGNILKDARPDSLGADVCVTLGQLANERANAIKQDFGKELSVLAENQEKMKATVAWLAAAKTRTAELAEAKSTDGADLKILASGLDEMLASYQSAIAQAEQAMIETEVAMKSVDQLASRVASDFANVSKFAAKWGEQWSGRMTSAISSITELVELAIATEKASDALVVKREQIADEIEKAAAVVAKMKANVKFAGVLGLVADVEKIGAEERPVFGASYVKPVVVVAGGADRPNGPPSLDERVKKQKEAHMALMGDFARKSKEIFGRMLSNVYEMGRKLGHGQVPMNDDLGRFVAAFDELQSVYNEGIEAALTGYRKSQTAAIQKDIFIGKLQALLSIANQLGEPFRQIKGTLEELQALVDTYNDKFLDSRKDQLQTRLVGGDWKEDMRSGLRSAGQFVANAPENIRKGSNWGANVAKATGDAARNLSSSATELGKAVGESKRNLAEAQTSALGGDDDDSADWASEEVAGGESQRGFTLRNVVASLKHFYSVARMRENLKKVSAESSKYSANYESVLGSAMSSLIDKERKDANRFREAFDAVDQPDSPLKPHLARVYATIKDSVKSAGSDNKMSEWSKEYILKVRQQTADAKIRLYEVLQAIDLYLMNFTDSITANPDEIKEMSRMLDSTEITADWFNEMSGDSVAVLFEYMPSETTMSNPTGAHNILTDEPSALEKEWLNAEVSQMKPKAEGAHYLKSVANAAGNPGNPFLVISPQRTLWARDFAKRAVERVMALKNIVTVFAFLGAKAAKSGGVAGGAANWTPKQFYEALVMYMYTSAFAQGWDGYDPSVPGTSPEKQAFALPYRPDGKDMIESGFKGSAASNIRNDKVLMGVLPAATTKRSGSEDPVFWSDVIDLPTGWKADEGLHKAERLRKGAETTRVTAEQARAREEKERTRKYKEVTEEEKKRSSISSEQKAMIEKHHEINAILRAAISRYDLQHARINDLQTKIKQIDTERRREKGMSQGLDEAGAINLLDQIDNIRTYLIEQYTKITALYAKDPDNPDIENMMKNAAQRKNWVKEAKRTLNEFGWLSNDDLFMKGPEDNFADLANEILVGVEGGATGNGWETMNWTEWCNSVQPPSGAARDWLIAFTVSKADKDMKTAPPFARAAFGAGMNSIKYCEADGNTPADEYANRGQKTVGGWSGCFVQTDCLFVHAIKSMVAKVFTVAGLYNMLNYAGPDDHTMSPTRFIIGGGSMGGVDNQANSISPANLPTIHDDAVELYIRLPLMVEFYRDIFSMNRKMRDTGDDERLIALVPEMDLAWSNLMRLSFDSMDTKVVTKNYAVRMINEINAVYDKYKSRGSSGMVSAVMNDFIADMNSRFGIMTRLEIKRYQDMLRRERDEGDKYGVGDMDLRDFDTLGGPEGSTPGPVPSDKFSKVGFKESAEEMGQTFEVPSFIEALRKFREDIDKKIRDVVYGPDAPANPHQDRMHTLPNFHDQARITKMTLKNATSPESRFNVVYSVMNGIDSVQSISEYAYVMFHEVVIGPLAILATINSTLGEFINVVRKSHEEMKNPDNHRKSFETLTRALLAHVSSMAGMVDVVTNGPKLIIDHSKLDQYCDDVMQFVQRNIQKFRGMVRSALIEEVSRTRSSLEYELMRNKFKGENEYPNSLGITASRLSECFGAFANDRSTAGSLPSLSDLKFGDELRRLIYYDTDMLVPPSIRPVITREDKMGRLMTVKAEGDKKTRVYENALLMSRWNFYLGPEPGFRGDRLSRIERNNAGSAHGMGLMMKFNEILSRYLEQFWDNPSNMPGKIYSGLISELASVMNSAVNEANGWPDVCSKQTTYGPRIEASFGEYVDKSFANREDVIGVEKRFAKPGVQRWAISALLIGSVYEIDEIESDINLKRDMSDEDKDAINIAIKEAAINVAKNLSDVSIATQQQAIAAIQSAFEVTAKWLPSEVYEEGKLLEGYSANIVDIVNRKLTLLRDTILSIMIKQWRSFGPVGAILAAGHIVGRNSGFNRNGTKLTAGELTSVIRAVWSDEGGIPSIPISPEEAKEDWGNPDEILFATLGRCIKTLMSEKTREGAHAYLMTEASDLLADALMRKNIKANLPIFAKMFSMLSSSCALLSKIISLGINTIPETVVDMKGERIKQMNVSGRVFAQTATHEGLMSNKEQSRAYFNRLLDKIKLGCDTIVTSANKVLGDLSADNNPLFLETDEGSIATYRNINNVTPFMPSSTMLMGLVDRQPDQGMPVHYPGSRDYQFNFGTRKVLAQANVLVMLDDMPGMREITENYNRMVSGDKQVAVEMVNSFLSKYVQLVRWATDVHIYSPLVGGLSSVASKSLIEVVDRAKGHNLYQVGKSLDSIVGLTTSSDKARSVSAIARSMGGGDQGGARDSLDRDKLQIYNLIDLNLPPININALRREIPLVNLLNYSFTFDSFAKDMLGRYTELDGLKTFAGASAVRGGAQFLQLVLHPHIAKDVSDTAWENLMAVYGNRGGDQAGFEGHDRFAYDQVCHKALMHVDRTGFSIKRYEEDIPADKKLFPIPADNMLAWPKDRNIHSRARSGNQTRDFDYGPGDNGGMNGATIGKDKMKYLRVLGRMRHDTTFIRNILFISTCQRMMRSKMSEEMTRVHFPVVSGPPVTNRRITEENSWEQW